MSFFVYSENLRLFQDNIYIITCMQHANESIGEASLVKIPYDFRQHVAENSNIIIMSHNFWSDI